MHFISYCTILVRAARSVASRDAPQRGGKLWVFGEGEAQAQRAAADEKQIAQQRLVADFSYLKCQIK
jgi:hypothetical protein